MSQFYARYIPPSAPNAAPADSTSTNHKRSAVREKGSKQLKKRKIDERDGEDILAKYSSSKASRGRDENGSSERKEAKRLNKSLTKRHISNKLNSELPISRITETNHGREREASSPALAQDESSNGNHKNKITSSREIESPDRNSPDLNAKHAKVLSRFRSTAPVSDEHSKAIADEESQQAITYHDLKPIPQPRSSVPKLIASYATAPEWLRQPIQVEQRTSNPPLKELGLSKAILRCLEAQAITTALPVQSTTLPLLLPRDVHERHDLCVAAATGSGKTLAYVLPILNNLEHLSATELRAVIVVPTRALVKQVVQTIDSCSAGMEIKVGTAEGSKPLIEEQSQLVEEIPVLDLDEWQRQRDAPIDWSTFSLEETLEQAGKKTSMDSVGYVTQYHSKVDIIVCTPGRLVEHLQTTKGFNLDNVDWFVADEADRLLNESYHEWLETVLPALKSQAATRQRDELLRSMYMDVPIRRVTKVLLSATMTKDISQLLLLDLTDPKLIVMPNETSADDMQDTMESVQDDEAEYRMPTELEELAIAFKDSENKPLYLLQLLEQHILSRSTTNHDNRALSIRSKTDADEISSSGSSDSGSEDEQSESSNTSDSESAGDATSVSSRSSSSSSSSSSDSAISQANNKIFPSTSLTSTHPRVLIFTKSTESAHRLSRLLALVEPNLGSKIATFSRSSSSTKSSSAHKTRSRILEAFSSGKTPLLICTDLAARGLDIPSLEHVINYDVPSSALTYVHRVGRTARAGREGKAWTLVEHKQGKWFWETIGGKTRSGAEEVGAKSKAIGRGRKTVQKLNLVVDQEQWMDRYEAALAKLGEDVRTR